MKAHAPFARLRAFMGALEGLVASGLPRAAAIHQLGDYRSRGKGRGFSPPGPSGVRRAWRQAAKRRNIARHKARCQGR